MKINNDMVIITEKRYKELIRKEKKGKIETIEAIIKMWEFIGHKSKNVNDFKGMSISKVLEGFYSEMEDLKDDAE